VQRRLHNMRINTPEIFFVILLGIFFSFSFIDKCDAGCYKANQSCCNESCVVGQKEGCGNWWCFDCGGGLGCFGGCISGYKNKCQGPYMYCCSKNESPEGYFDNANCSVLWGWARDPDTTDPIYIEIYSDGNLLESALANKRRADLCNLWGNGDKDCYHGFELSLSPTLCDGVSHRVSVFAKDSEGGPGQELQGSPKWITCHAPRATISGPASGKVGDALSFTAEAFDTDNNLTKVQIFYAPTTADLSKGESWTLCGESSFAPVGSRTITKTCAFSSPGSYWVVANAYDSGQCRCTGNPSYINPYWSRKCGTDSYMTVNITPQAPEKRSCADICIQDYYGSKAAAFCGKQVPEKCSHLKCGGTEETSDWWCRTDVVEIPSSQTSDCALNQTCYCYKCFNGSECESICAPPPQNQPPTCDLLSIPTSIAPGKKVVISANASDDKAIDKVEFFYTPLGANFCNASSWIFIDKGYISDGTWKAEWDTTGVVPGDYYVVANVWDKEGAWCTGNPGGSCDSTAVPCGKCAKKITIVSSPECPDCKVEGICRAHVEKVCTADNVKDYDISELGDSIDDYWCTWNVHDNCLVSSGVQLVNGQINPDFWEGESCGADDSGDSSILFGEKKVYVDDISKYKILARLTIDDNSQLWINGKEVPGLKRECCGWTCWVNVTGYFESGWNEIKFKAEDVCSGERHFNLDWDVSPVVGWQCDPEDEMMFEPEVMEINQKLTVRVSSKKPYPWVVVTVNNENLGGPDRSGGNYWWEWDFTPTEYKNYVVRFYIEAENNDPSKGKTCLIKSFTVYSQKRNCADICIEDYYGTEGAAFCGFLPPRKCSHLKCGGIEETSDWWCRTDVVEIPFGQTLDCSSEQTCFCYRCFDGTECEEGCLSECPECRVDGICMEQLEKTCTIDEAKDHDVTELRDSIDDYWCTWNVHDGCLVSSGIELVNGQKNPDFWQGESCEIDASGNASILYGEKKVYIDDITKYIINAIAYADDASWVWINGNEVPRLHVKGGWGEWVDVTNYFKTGWNEIKFKADDYCSEERYFNLDWDIALRPTEVCLKEEVIKMAFNIINFLKKIVW